MTHIFPPIYFTYLSIMFCYMALEVKQTCDVSLRVSVSTEYILSWKHRFTDTLIRYNV